MRRSPRPKRREDEFLARTLLLAESISLGTRKLPDAAETLSLDMIASGVPKRLPGGWADAVEDEIELCEGSAAEGCGAGAGKSPVCTKWIDFKKGEGVGSRLVAQEFSSEGDKGGG